MLLVDDVLAAPFKGLLSIFTEIVKAAEQEMTGNEQNIRQELSELYKMLETRRITEEEFAARETELLDRLERMESSKASAGGEESEETEEEQQDESGTG